MTRNRYLVSLIVCVLGSAPGEARAWDSVTKPQIRNFPSSDVVIDDFSDYILPGKRAFAVKFFKDAIGGTASYTNDVDNSNLLTCSQEFLQTGDISFCDISGEINKTKWSWAEIRKVGEQDRRSEHTLIAREAATRAGLLGTHMFDVFWLRYASYNSYLASPLDLSNRGLTRSDTRYLVGQSYLPSGGLSNGAHATRSASLLEFAQLPDLSNSLGDWAAGNEICPLDGVAGAYEGDPNEACHVFELSMGAVNVTHFKPLNRAMWDHYHALALKRMQRCRELDQKLSQQFTTDFAFNFADVKPFSNHYTEAHECMREAMAYEMFGQHFLQDAWSTGHMWHRWGYPSLTQFDDHLIGEDLNQIPPENRPARRAMLATLVGVASGMVHGAKSKVQYILEKYNGDLAASRLVDDPLNGPVFYLDPAGHNQGNIEWRSGDDKYQGAGDNFWRPIDARVGTVYESPQFREQRDRLLNCSAKSMLDVFRAGPPIMGEAQVTAEIPAIDNIDLSSDYCWSQLATNTSMLRAIGVFSGAYTGSFFATDISRLVTGMLIDSVIGSGFNFPRGREGDYPDDQGMQARVRDRDRFNNFVTKRLRMRLGELREIYARNAEKSPIGTESSRGCKDASDCPPVGVPVDIQKAITVLDVPPINPRELSHALEDIPYLDQLDADAETTTELDKAMPRVFWRGNVDFTCLESIQDDAQRLNDLREACIEGADGTGDPDSCTECTYRAEALIPFCNDPARPDVGASRCSALGAISNAAPPGGLPAVWFDNRQRWNPPQQPGEPKSEFLCAAPFYVAMTWCTGTPMTFNEPREVPWTFAGPSEITQSVPCAGGPRDFRTVFLRKASILPEPRPTEMLFGNHIEYVNGPWLPMFVTAFAEEETFEPGDIPCLATHDKVTSSLDSIRQANLSNAEHPELPGATLDELLQPLYGYAASELSWCGHMQRATVWEGSDANCIAASASLGYSRRAQGIRFADTGEYFNEFTVDSNPGCYIKEKRRFKPTCTDPMATCNAGWQCVEGQPLPAVRKIAPPDEESLPR